VREGYVGESSKPEYSSGRGGAGNIVDSPRVRPVGDNSSSSEDVIPEPAMRNAAGYDNFHTGVSVSQSTIPQSLWLTTDSARRRRQHLQGKIRRPQCCPCPGEREDTGEGKLGRQGQVSFWQEGLEVPLWQEGLKVTSVVAWQLRIECVSDDKGMK
jgi:hypothetical protein